MRYTHRHDRPLRIGSLFSGFGGLDIAVEHAFNAETVWFSEVNEPIARVFSRHWPEVPNLGDITTIAWRKVPPVDVLCGGFPCQDVSTLGKRAGLAPGTRSGLWAHMATAIDALRPRLVVIENVRGLLSSPAVHTPLQGDDDAQRNPGHAIYDNATLRVLERDPWHLGDQSAEPLRAAGAVLGDLADLRYDTQWIGLPASIIGAPHRRFRVFVLAYPQEAVSHTASGGRFSWRRDPGTGQSASGKDGAESSDHRSRPARTRWLADQHERIGDLVQPDREHLQRWGRYAAAVARWEHITARQAPGPTILNKHAGPRPSPAFVEWIMGIPRGWVTDPVHGLVATQQIAALGNGVLPLQATSALGLVLETASCGDNAWSGGWA
ncbi:DNA (cytosine-5-)-methyltransferase [Aeromicrobium sp. PE09-221]|nr:DNA (cytosine-5-)-methyltransferase [Aeromicrobium sp. PE09-221]